MSKINYQGFGYTVDSCPRNYSEFTESASRLNCGVDENGRSRYACVPNIDMSATVEFCYNRSSIGLYEKGNCLAVSDHGYLDHVSCSEFRKGCPSNHYFISELYKYPACHDINQQERCFHAEPACPDTNYFNGIGNTPENNGSISQESMALIIAGVLIVFVLAVIMVVIIFKKWRTKEAYGVQDIEMPLLPQEEGLHRYQGDYSLWKRDTPDTVESQTFVPKDKKIEKDAVERDLLKYLGDYSVWETKLSDTFRNLSSDQKAVLFCFVCSDHGAPDFTDDTMMFILNVTRRYTFNIHDNVTQREAQQILDGLNSSEFLCVNEDGVDISEDTKDEIMYLIVEHSPANSDYNLFLFSFNTTWKYLRCHDHTRKPGEKCIISPGVVVDYIIIRRLQMDILNHVTMEDPRIHNEVFQILNIPHNILKQDKKDRKKFLDELKLKGQSLKYKNSYHSHVQWLSRFWRPDIARSCIGLFPHHDIYIINNMAYRISNDCHGYTEEVRCLLYCLLFADEYTVDIKNDSCKNLLKKIRERYFTELAISDYDDVKSLPEEVHEFTQIQDGLIAFKSEKIRHDVMYAFITECLIQDNDLEFFLASASSCVISEYCRSWKYERREHERCLYIPDRPPKMYDLFIEKLHMDIVKHCTVSDRSIHHRISESLSVPQEVLGWDLEVRERYVEYAGRGTQTVHQARGMIVGCAGAGKTTLLKRLLRCSEDEILNVTQTKGLDVHEEVFEISEEGKLLKAEDEKKIYEGDKAEDVEIIYEREKGTHRGKENGEGNPRKTLTFFDFGGQCAYYACHQIYLTRRAFYIVVVDASRCLDDVVDEKVCDQKNSVFFGWTYGDYFVFWIKSIHTYCGTELEQDHATIVVIVATHWENGQRLYENKEEFIEELQSRIPPNSNLLQYIREDRCFLIQFPVEPLEDLEEYIRNIVRNKRWEEKIPKEWAYMYFEIEINQKKDARKILTESDIATMISENEEAGLGDIIREQRAKKDMLRFYHDTGKILYFNEQGLDKLVIIDVQWFVDAFKNIITDKLHMKGIPCSRENWKDFYETGYLKDNVLTEIWKQKEILRKESEDAKNNILGGNDTEFSDIAYFKPGISEHREHPKQDPPPDPRDFLLYKESILNFMQRLGLIATGVEAHYIPCMNHKVFDEETQKVIRESNVKTSILIFQFEFLPYFFFFRLVVACMRNEFWKVLGGQKSCLYRNAALFSSGGHHIVIAATANSIQLQVYQPKPECSLEVNKTKEIQSVTEEILKNITATFHRRIGFVRGFSCKNENDQSITMEIDNTHFIKEREIVKGDNEICPRHPIKDHHFVDMNKLTKYWKIDK